LRCCEERRTSQQQNIGQTLHQKPDQQTVHTDLILRTEFIFLKKEGDRPSQDVFEGDSQSKQKQTPETIKVQTVI
jgi:hypothetical protein